MAVEDQYAKKVFEFLSRTDSPVCDACVNETQKINSKNRTTDMAAALGATDLFKRAIGTCSICNKRMAVTVHA